MSEIVAGLCSVTFRALEAEAVLRLAERANLGAIEWGADVHVPPTDPERARRLATLCADDGVACPSYGTYFVAGRNADADFEPVLDTAEALGASLLRVWAPFGVMPGDDETSRDDVAAALRACAERAAARDLQVALEFHPGTLTHTAAGALDLLAHAGDDVSTYWQPRPGEGADLSLPELEAVAHRLAHLHVFSWDPTGNERQPLSHFETLWHRALQIAAEAPALATPRCAYLEFVPDDSPESLARDAADLVRWIREET